MDIAERMGIKFKKKAEGGGYCDVNVIWNDYCMKMNFIMYQ